MSRQAGNKRGDAQFSRGLAFNKKLPPFLQRLNAQVNGTIGQPSSSSSRFPGEGEEDSPSVVEAHPGRAAIPERPREGKWAKGSDDEGDGHESTRKKGKAKIDLESEEEGDDWDKQYGGGGGGGVDDEGPQIVVLKEGKHMSKDEVDAVRKANKPNGGKDDLTPFPTSVILPSTRATLSDKSILPVASPVPSASMTSTNKRKLLADEKTEKGRKNAKMTKKDVKKEKDKKGLLSFGEEE